MTNSLSDHMLDNGNFIYRDTRYKKLLLCEQRSYDHFNLRYPDGVKRLEAYNNILVPFADKLSLRKAITYLQKPNPASMHGFEQILIENGASTTVPCYSETHIVNSAKEP